MTAKKKVKNTTKAATTNGALATAASIASGILGAKLTRYGIPLEAGVTIAGGVVGTLFAFVGRWAAKLNPND